MTLKLLKKNIENGIFLKTYSSEFGWENGYLAVKLIIYNVKRVKDVEIVHNIITYQGNIQNVKIIS